MHVSSCKENTANFDEYEYDAKAIINAIKVKNMSTSSRKLQQTSDVVSKDACQSSVVSEIKSLKNIPTDDRITQQKNAAQRIRRVREIIT